MYMPADLYYAIEPSAPVYSFHFRSQDLGMNRFMPPLPLRRRISPMQAFVPNKSFFVFLNPSFKLNS